MATQICPNCKEDSFTWSIDEEETPLTQWGCHECGYFAYEDESFERLCLKCKNHTEIRLEDDSKKYWWCGGCSMATEIDIDG